MKAIEKAPLVKIFENLVKSWSGRLSGPAYANALERIRKAPEIEVIPVTYAQWVRKDLGGGYRAPYKVCSQCGYCPPVTWQDREQHFTKHCPECLATMEGTS